MCTSSLTDLLPLSPRRQRLLKIMIAKLRNQLGFIDGANQSWPTDYSKRQEAARLFITPDLFDLIDVRPITADEYQTAVERHRNEPRVIETVGVDETAKLLIGTREAYLQIHFEEWSEALKEQSESSEPFYLKFKAQVPVILSRATADVRAEWPDRETWFDDVCVPRANAMGEIETRIEIWCTRARNLEEELLSQVPSVDPQSPPSAAPEPLTASDEQPTPSEPDKPQESPSNALPPSVPQLPLPEPGAIIENLPAPVEPSHGEVPSSPEEPQAAEPVTEAPRLKPAEIDPGGDKQKPAESVAQRAKQKRKRSKHKRTKKPGKPDEMYGIKPAVFDAFMDKMLAAKGEKINRDDICLVAGRSRTVLERVQRFETNKATVVRFRNVLGLDPEEFFRRLGVAKEAAERKRRAQPKKTT
jgi:hypothetical protein